MVGVADDGFLFVCLFFVLFSTSTVPFSMFRPILLLVGVAGVFGKIEANGGGMDALFASLGNLMGGGGGDSDEGGGCIDVFKCPAGLERSDNPVHVKTSNGCGPEGRFCFYS